MDDRQRRIARARLLRRQGKTYDEIRAVIGPVDDSTLRAWCRGIDRPPETFRSGPLEELRRECRRLRALGYTYTEIAEATGACHGSISSWVRDVRVPNQDRAERRRLTALRKSARERSRQAQRKRDVQTRVAAAAVGPLTDRELFLVGVALYWAEGSKSKSYDLRERITFINSDPLVIDTFMAWLGLLGVSEQTCRFRLQIHETADVADAEEFWAARLGVPRGVFLRATLKKHSPKTNRLNTGDEYRGCLVISVLKSADLYRNVAGWWTGLHAQATVGHRRSTEWGEMPPWLGWRQFRVN